MTPKAHSFCGQTIGEYTNWCYVCIMRSSSYSWKVLMTTLREESGVVLNPGDEILVVGVSSRWMSSLCHDCLNITREHTNVWEIVFTKRQSEFLDIVVISRMWSLLRSTLQSPTSSSPWAASALSLWQACSSHSPNSTGASPPPPLPLPQVNRFFSANKNQRSRVYSPQNVSF